MYKRASQIRQRDMYRQADCHFARLVNSKKPRITDSVPAIRRMDEEQRAHFLMRREESRRLRANRTSNRRS